MSDAVPQSPFLRLPLEIRLIIYEYLLFPSASPSSSHSYSIANLLPDYHTYYSSDTNSNPFTLTVRTIDPYVGKHSSRTWRKRTTYHVHTGPFLHTLHPTTYRILLSPYTHHLRKSIPSLLPLNRQIHAEASKLLYSTYTFSFHANIESLVPFLSDLTPNSRSAIRAIQVTKKALPYTKEFDRAEWAHMCKYLSTNPELRIQYFLLSIVAGRPGNGGWDHVRAIGKTEFEALRRVQKEWNGSRGNGGVDLEWAEQLMGIRGLRELDIKAVVEHCPAPRSEMMAFWVAFSKSIEGGFGEWVREVMVGGE